MQSLAPAVNGKQPVLRFQKGKKPSSFQCFSEEVFAYFSQMIAYQEIRANKGDSIACCSLGAIFQQMKDKKSSREWYKKAALMGNSIGQYYMGMSSFNEKDFTTAENWLQMAAKQGHFESQKTLESLRQQKKRLNS